MMELLVWGSNALSLFFFLLFFPVRVTLFCVFFDPVNSALHKRGSCTSCTDSASPCLILSLFPLGFCLSFLCVLQLFCEMRTRLFFCRTEHVQRVSLFPVSFSLSLLHSSPSESLPTWHTCMSCLPLLFSFYHSLSVYGDAPFVLAQSLLKESNVSLCETKRQSGNAEK